jgi:hypothetical protein
MSTHATTFDFTITGRSKGDNYFSSPKNGSRYGRDERKRRQIKLREKRKERLNAIAQERDDKQYFVESADEYEPEVPTVTPVAEESPTKMAKVHAPQSDACLSVPIPPSYSATQSRTSSAKTPTAPMPRTDDVFVFPTSAGIAERVILNKFKSGYEPILEIIDITQPHDLFPKLFATGKYNNSPNTPVAEEQNQEAEDETLPETSSETSPATTFTFDFAPMARAKGKKPVFKTSPKNGQMFAKDEKKQMKRTRRANKKDRMKVRKQARAEKNAKKENASVLEEYDQEMYMYQTEWPDNLSFMVNRPAEKFTKIVKRPADKYITQDRWYIFHLDGGCTTYWDATGILPTHLENFQEIVEFVETHYETYYNRYSDTLDQIAQVFGVPSYFVKYDNRSLDINDQFLRDGHLKKRKNWYSPDFSYLRQTYVEDLVKDAITFAGWI